MGDILEKIINMILDGGNQSIFALLIVIIAALIYDRMRLLENIKKQDERVIKVLDDYYRGTLTITQAMNSLKIVLIEIKSKI